MTKKVAIDLKILRETDMAFLVTDGGDGDDQWIPKSQIEGDHSNLVGTTTEIVIPEWLAIRKGYV